MNETTITAAQYQTDPPTDPDTMVTLKLNTILLAGVESAQREPDTGAIILTCSNGRDYRVAPDHPLTVHRGLTDIDLTDQPPGWNDLTPEQRRLLEEAGADVLTVGDAARLFPERESLPPMDAFDADIIDLTGDDESEEQS